MANRRSSAVLLWVQVDRWTAVVDGEVIGETTLAKRRGWEVGAAQRLLDELNQPLGAPVVVALESDLCLPFAFQTASRNQARSRDAVAFQIEEPLPVAAEEVVADYVAEGVNVFGVAADRRLVEGALGELLGTGLEVTCVAPAAMLAAAELVAQRRDVTRSWWVRPDAIEQIEWGAAGPSHWRTLPRAIESFHAAVTTQRLAGVEFDAQAVVTADATGSPPDVEAAETLKTTHEDPLVEYAALAADRLARGEATAPIDLVRGLSSGSLARRDPLRWDRLAVAVALLFVVLAAGAWRGAVALAAERELQRLEGVEAEVFSAALPDARVPRGVRTRLQSELRRLTGTRAELADLPEHADAALRLESVLTSLPNKLRFRLLEIRIESGRVFLLGEARSYSDADRIAAALRGSGLVVSPPSSRQLAERGVEFRLTAEEPSEPSTAQEKRR